MFRLKPFYIDPKRGLSRFLFSPHTHWWFEWRQPHWKLIKAWLGIVWLIYAGGFLWWLFFSDRPPLPDNVDAGGYLLAALLFLSWLIIRWLILLPLALYAFAWLRIGYCHIDYWPTDPKGALSLKFRSGSLLNLLPLVGDLFTGTPEHKRYFKDISRIEVGLRGDQFERPAHKRDRIQIRVWTGDDLEFDVMTENVSPSSDNRKLAEIIRRQMQAWAEEITPKTQEVLPDDTPDRPADRGNPLDL